MTFLLSFGRNQWNKCTYLHLNIVSRPTIWFIIIKSAVTEKWKKSLVLREDNPVVFYETSPCPPSHLQLRLFFTVFILCKEIIIEKSFAELFFPPFFSSVYFEIIHYWYFLAKKLLNAQKEIIKFQVFQVQLVQDKASVLLKRWK